MAIKKEDIGQYVGKTAEPSPWLEITQEQVNQFADCTHDHQFIHTDPEKAAKTPFGGTIAHGMLTLALLPKLTEGAQLELENLKMAVNYGFDKIRFLFPVRVGKRVRAVVTYSNIIEKKPGQIMTTMGVTVEIEGEDKPALLADWVIMQVVG